MRRLILIALCVSAASSPAQERPTVLTLPAGARALGVGDAFTAGRSPEVIFYNPAQLAIQTGIAASVQRYSASSGSGSYAGVHTLPLGAIGFGLQYLSFHEGLAGVRAAPAPLATRGTAHASSMAVSLALAPPAIKGIRSGLAAKFVEERIGNARDGGAAFDVGLARDFFGRATFAFSAQNLGTALRIDGVASPLPTRYTLGAAVQSPPFGTYFDAAAVASVSYLQDGTIVPAGGGELSYVPLDGWSFTARAGARRVVDRSDGTPLTLGAGVSLDRVSLDYALDPMDAGGASHRVGLRVR